MIYILIYCATVFLRKLDYFQGVLFLTTNRKDDFDDAFKSRIHVTITYPALSPASQSAIWRNLIKKDKLQTDGSWTDEVFAELGLLSLNVSIHHCMHLYLLRSVCPPAACMLTLCRAEPWKTCYEQPLRTPVQTAEN